MAFLDIEKIINQPEIGSRFKLVHLAGLRARELNNPDENTVLSTVKPGEKVTSKALADLVKHRITFEEVVEEENKEDNKNENN